MHNTFGGNLRTEKGTATFNMAEMQLQRNFEYCTSVQFQEFLIVKINIVLQIKIHSVVLILIINTVASIQLVKQVPFKLNGNNTNMKYQNNYKLLD